MKKAMMNVWLVCVMAVAGNDLHGAIVHFVPPGPGINATMDSDLNTTDYGWKSLQTGNWSFDGDSASIDNNNGVARYRATNLGDTAAGPVTPMPQTQDCVLEIVYRHTGAYGSEWPWFVKAEENAADARIVHLRYIGPRDTWRLYAGDGGGGWSPIGNTFSLGSDFNKFTVHYKSASSTIDAFLNDVPIPGATGFTLGHGNYKPDMVQLEWMRQGTDSYRSLKLGQLVPESATMVMAGVAFVLALVRRSRRN